jgi:hypothetical protein
MTVTNDAFEVFGVSYKTLYYHMKIGRQRTAAMVAQGRQNQL